MKPSVSLRLLWLSIVTAAGAGCHVLPPAAVESPSGAVTQRTMVRTDLYFGLSRSDGRPITPAEFDAFLRGEVTPRFPEGLTVLAADGQWWDGNRVAREPSRVLILLHPATQDADAKIEQLRAIYRQRFDQQSVLRTDEPEQVSF